MRIDIETFKLQLRHRLGDQQLLDERYVERRRL